MKDPDTGRRVSRPNPEADLIVTDVPGLRILSDEAWQAAKTRQQQVRQIVAGGNIGRAMRPLHLFSGLTRCGECGSSYVVLGAPLGLQRDARAWHLHKPSDDPTGRA